MITINAPIKDSAEWIQFLEIAPADFFAAIPEKPCPPKSSITMRWNWRNQPVHAARRDVLAAIAQEEANGFTSYWFAPASSVVEALKVARSGGAGGA